MSSRESIEKGLIIIDNCHYEVVPFSMRRVFEAISNSKSDKAADSDGTVTIKMMDTILFEEGMKPVKWIFTDLMGRIQFKDI
jgi:hypothetical protein